MAIPRSTFTLIAVALLAARVVRGQTITIDPSKIEKPVSHFLTGACLEDVNHEVYGGLSSQLIFGESFQEPASRDGVSRMWRTFRRRNTTASAAIESADPFNGSQSQSLSFQSGAGEFGIENKGLNRRGISVIAQKSYDGYLWLRSNGSVEAAVSLASGDGSHIYATATLSVSDRHWQRYDFTLAPNSTDPAARFEISLKNPSLIVVGRAFLEPGEWGRFKRLPVRRDVVEGLLNERVTVMRYGGSMVNAPEYRWKKMVGPSDHRPPYQGKWYPQSSNSWGIADFLNLCEAAELLGIPVFNIDETPSDMADFVEYANGSADSQWGRKRIADGHPSPYGLTHLELGNEEKIDDQYFEQFASIANAVWRKDPQMILVVGDFLYSDPIENSNHFTGAASSITNLSTHQKILDLAKKYNAEVWFDVHVVTEFPPASRSLIALPSYIDAIDKLSNGARHQVVVFELNANNCDQRRAISNAQAIIRMEKDGRPAIVCSANCLQCDGQNDNGWNQGLLFLNPQKVWLQPPGYVLQMFSRSYQPALIACSVGDDANPLEAAATISDDRKTVVLQVVNLSGKPATANIEFADVKWVGSKCLMQTLAANPLSVNTAKHPDQVSPKTSTQLTGGSTIFPANSFSVCTWTR